VEAAGVEGRSVATEHLLQLGLALQEDHGALGSFPVAVPTCVGARQRDRSAPVRGNSVEDLLHDRSAGDKPRLGS
jgi:hypothetical protein